MTELTPREIVRELDRYIIGQDDAKRAVAVALRNRYRRSRLPEDIRRQFYAIETGDHTAYYGEIVAAYILED